jgi:hypothetical protein
MPSSAEGSTEVRRGPSALKCSCAPFGRGVAGLGKAPAEGLALKEKAAERWATLGCLASSGQGLQPGADLF